jgi:aspartate-semialdehyde dehydrogenase
MNMQEFKAKWHKYLFIEIIPQCDVFEENGYTKENEIGS